MKKLQLSPQDRAFLARVTQSAFANPFTSAREENDAAIAGDRQWTPQTITRVTAMLAARLARLAQAGIGTLAALGGHDRELLHYAALFDIYHRCNTTMDELILAQTQAGEVSVPARFAREVLALFTQRGFSETAAQRYFGVFYQMRRAFYFIQRGLVGSAPCMHRLRAALWNNIFTHDIHAYDLALWNRMEDFSTLLLGETGTGKGAAAGAIGRSAFIPFDAARGRFVASFTKTFVQINLSQFPETLIESELFGHRKGAFTGAVEAHDGVLALSSPYGAVFLDEIGDVSVHVQLKLLRVLQERVFTPVGAHTPQRFQGRVIAATNKPLDELRRRGAFRDDFYYRLCSDVITVPSLRERLREEPRELPLLIEHVLTRLLGQPARTLVAAVQHAVPRCVAPDYAWPGNVRELEQCVRSILLTNAYHAQRTPRAPQTQTRLLQGITAQAYDVPALIGDYCKLLFERHGAYLEVARRTGLDRRTVKKYVEME
jgi:transcriptional regulator with AAA-type ATPase domain